MRTSAALLALIFLGCGPGIPTHDGYKKQGGKPWKKARQLELDKLGEAEVDDTVSYPRRRRARWYAIDLPSFGEMKVELSYAPLLFGQSEKDLDVAFEVLNADHRVITRADKEEPDAGEEKKSRTLYELRPGRYLVHVYLQDRIDEAEFTLRLAFQPQEGGGGSTSFPAEVEYVGALAAVPPVDDAPPPKPDRRPRRRRRPKKPQEKETEEVTSIRARISGITAAGSGTRIRIDRGENHGVAVGWRGNVVTSAGGRIPGGAFSVTKVTAGESYANVKATADAVTSAKYVILRPPSDS